MRPVRPCRDHTYGGGAVREGGVREAPVLSRGRLLGEMRVRDKSSSCCKEVCIFITDSRGERTTLSRT